MSARTEPLLGSDRDSGGARSTPNLQDTDWLFLADDLVKLVLEDIFSEVCENFSLDQKQADPSSTGGSSYFIDHGFGCDNVAAYEIVLANGTILNVTKSAYSDLFKALKGGSSNFGIVTSFTIRTFQLGGIWGGNIFYQAEPTLDQQLKAFNEFTANDDYDINAAVQMSISFSPSVGNVFVNQPFYALPQINPPALQPFTKIQPQLGNQTALDTLPTFAVTDAASSPDGFR